jgi:type I restriction enzyme S subunit
MSGWVESSFASLCRPRREIVAPSKDGANRYVGLEGIEPLRLSIRSWAPDNTVRSSKFRFRKGDLLFAKLRPYQRKAAVAEWDGVCSTDILVLEPSPTVDPYFLGFLTLSTAFVDHAIATTEGVSLPRTSWSSLARFKAPCPSLTEQRVAAHILCGIRDAIDVQDRIVQGLRALKTALLARLFRQGFETGASRPTPFGSVPGSWKLGQLGDYALVQGGVTKGKKAEGTMVERPYLRVANVQDGYLDLRDIKSISLRSDEVERYLLRDGDVLVTEGGDFDKLGRGYIWRNQIEGCVHQNHVFAVRPDQTFLLPDFLSYLFQSPYGKAYFLTVAHKTTNLASINSTKLKEFPVLLPELGEQRQISAIVHALDTAVQQHCGRQTGYEELLTTVVESMFAERMNVAPLVEA